MPAILKWIGKMKFLIMLILYKSKMLTLFGGGLNVITMMCCLYCNYHDVLFYLQISDYSLYSLLFIIMTIRYT